MIEKPTSKTSSFVWFLRVQCLRKCVVFTTIRHNICFCVFQMLKNLRQRSPHNEFQQNNEPWYSLSRLPELYILHILLSKMLLQWRGHKTELWYIDLVWAMPQRNKCGFGFREFPEDTLIHFCAFLFVVPRLQLMPLSIIRLTRDCNATRSAHFSSPKLVIRPLATSL